MASRFVAPKRLTSLDEVQKAMQKIQEQLDALSPARRTAVQIRSFTLIAGEFVRASPRQGSTIVAKLPKASADNFGQTVQISLESPNGTLRVSAQAPDTVNGVRATNYSAATLITLQSNGVDSWVSVAQLPSTSPGGAALDAQYIVGAAHGSLPNASVLTDSTTIDVTATPGGTATAELKALTGAIETTAGTLATRSRNMRTNGVLQTPRTFYNFIDTNTVSWSPFDDAANDEWEVRATARAGNWRDNGSLQTAQVFVNQLSGNAITASITQDAPNQELELRHDFTGSTSVVTVTNPTGNMGTIDISALECGGCVELVTPLADFEIEGFTAKPNGFFFFLSSTNTDFTARFNEEDGTATSTDRMRLPNGTNARVQAPQAVIFYSRTRWRVVFFQNKEEVQTYTTAGLTSDLALNAKTTCLRVDTGNSDWSIDSIAGGYDGRRILLMNASNQSSNGRIVTGASSVGTAGNLFITPQNVDIGGENRFSALIEYDGTDSVWRIIAHTGFACLANNSLLVNAAGANNPPIETTVDTTEVFGGNFSEGPTTTGLIVHDEVDFMRNLHTPRTPRLAIFEEEFQGNVLGCTDRFVVMDNLVNTSATTFAEDTSSGTTIEYLGAVTVGFSHATAGDSSSGFCLGSSGREMNGANPSRPFNWQSLRYFGCIVRTTTAGIAARTQIALGLCGPFNSFGGFGTVGLMGGTSEAACFDYDTTAGVLAAREWRCGIRTSGASSSTGSGVIANNGSRTLLEIIKTAAGTLYYYVNGTLIRTDATGALHVSAFCNFYMVSRASTNAVRTISIDWLKVVCQSTANRHD